MPRRWLLPLFLLGSVWISAICHAEEAESASLDEAWALIEEQRQGLRLGAFLVRPEASVSGIYDSNIFATRSDEVEDSILVFSPALEASSVWREHELNFELGGAIGRYGSNTDEDYDDYWVSADGRYDLSSRTNVFGGLGYTFEHEDRGSPEDDLAGDEPTTFDSGRAHAGVSHAWERFTLRIGGTYEELDFDDADPVNNQDRDRTLSGAGARLSYTLNSRYTLFGQGVWDDRDYEIAWDDAGFRRDSDGYRAAVGVMARISNRLKGEAYVGYIRQEYVDTVFSDVSTADFGGNLSWRASPRTTLSANLDRTLEETTLPGSSGYLYTALSGKASHKLAPRLNVSAGISVAEADYQEVSRSDDYYSAELGMRYYLAPRWYLAAKYRVLQRNSDSSMLVDNPANPQDSDDYGRNQFFLTLGSLLYPVPQGRAWDMASGDALLMNDSGWPGAYAGALLGHNALNVETTTPRNAGSADTDPYSDSAGSIGLFAGFGWEFDRWYLGLELEADDSHTGIYHRKDKDSSVTLEVERGSSYGAAAQLGYRFPGGLLYGRVGAVRTDFDSFYTVNGKSESGDDSVYTETGVRLGLGADIPTGQNLFVRLDYTVTDYDDYSASVVDIQDRPRDVGFEPREDLFRLGLGWRWGSTVEAPISRDLDYRGLYAGVQVGHGALQSDLEGIHTDSGTDPGVFAFTGDFGDDARATGGVFFGYGLQYDKFYLGLEGQLEDSNSGWFHDRSPTGRDFSVEKMDTRGASLRGGYLLDNGSLLYARVGNMRSRFNTTWIKGGNRLNDVDRDDTVSGTRVGLGAEMPISRSVFARMDYSVTEYDSYDFVTAHGNPDSMTFDNREALFRLGLGARF